MHKRTMTLNLTEAEMSALESLCREKELSKTQVMKQALRLYQYIEARVKLGEKVFVEDSLKKEKAEIKFL